MPGWDPPDLGLRMGLTGVRVKEPGREFVVCRAVSSDSAEHSDFGVGAGGRGVKLHQREIERRKEERSK